VPGIAFGAVLLVGGKPTHFGLRTPTNLVAGVWKDKGSLGSQKAVSFLGNFVELERKEIHLPMFSI
jgi:hypothetical protein